MDTTAWTVIGTALTILIAIGAAFRAIRLELRQHRKELLTVRETLNERIDAQGRELTARIDALGRELTARIDALGRELTARIDALDQQIHRLEVELRERMAKLEGLLEGLREAITGPRAA